MEDLYRERTALFEKYADITISSDEMELADTIDKVQDILNEYLIVTE